MENTLVMIKPDAVSKKLVGRIISIYEENELSIEDMYIGHLEKEILEKHYEEHAERDFYSALIEFMTEDRVVVMKLVGKNAVKAVREINGTTNPSDAKSGSLRNLFGESIQRNVVHGSETVEEAKRELALWFN